MEVEGAHDRYLEHSSMPVLAIRRPSAGSPEDACSTLTLPLLVHRRNLEIRSPIGLLLPAARM
jgi:hypothetical protein